MRQHSSRGLASTRQTCQHLPTWFARTRQTRRHSPNWFARTRQTRRHSPKAIFEKNVTRLDTFARVMSESHEFEVSGHCLLLTLIYPLPSKQVDSYQKFSLPPSQIVWIQKDFDLSFIRKDIGSTNQLRSKTKSPAETEETTLLIFL